MSVKKNFLYSIIYQILSLIIPLVTAPYISRVIGLEGVGVYAYTNSIAQYFVLFSILGLNNYGNRSISRVRNNKVLMSSVFWNIYSLQLLTSLVSLVAYIVFVFHVTPDYYKNAAIIQIILVASAMFDINWFFFGIEQFKLTVTRNSIIKIVTFFSMFVFVKSTEDLNNYILLVVTSVFISQLVLWFFIKKYIIFVKPSISQIIAHIKPNFILFIPVVAISIYRIMSKIMIGSLSSIEQTALYENADKIVTIPLAIFTALSNVMLPRMSNMVANGEKEESKRYVRDSMQFVVFLSTAMMFGLWAISSRFAPIYFGESFKESGKLIAGLAPIALFSSWASVIRTQYLIPRGKDKEYVTSVVLGAIVNIFINSLLIGRYGAAGAVIGTVLAEFTVMAYQTYIVRHDLDIKTYLKDSRFAFISGLMMFFILRLSQLIISNTVGGLIIQVILGVILYLVINCVMYKLWDKERYNYFIKIIEVNRLLSWHPCRKSNISDGLK